MTRRLTISILVSLWAILLAGSAVAYVSMRTILLEDMDRSIMARALTDPRVDRQASAAVAPENSPDRIVIYGAPHSAERLPATTAPEAPRMLSARFAWANGQRFRSVTVAARTLAGEPVTIVCSRSTEQFDRYLNQFLVVLGVFTAATGLIVAWLAHSIAAAALRPLRQTAETIGTINEKHLDRRIDVRTLPPELRSMAERLNEMLARLESSFASRRQFLADASHELRTPVAAMVTSLEVALLRPRDAQQYRQTLEQALLDAQYLQQLSEGLLDAVRSERPAAEQLEPVDLPAVLRSCCEILSPLAQKRNVSLSVDAPASLVIASDERRIRGVIINLVGNAIEYNRRGGSVDVSCSVETPPRLDSFVVQGRVKDGLATVIRVRDTGEGISAENLPRIFDPFYRVDTARTGGGGQDSEGGATAAHLGLGLALVKQHIETLGGDLHVSSSVGVGTIVTIILDQPVGGERSYGLAEVKAPPLIAG